MGCFSSKHRKTQNDGGERTIPINPLQTHIVDQVPTPSTPISVRYPETILGKGKALGILGKPFEDIRKFYSLGKELGRGGLGITYMCKEISTGNNYACKSILKRKLISEQGREDVKTEIQIMQHLFGQPNVVEIKGAYEDRQYIHLVMELCAGGELFDRIIARGHYSERAAAGIIRSIVSVVQICHLKGVIHRDLKPENFLFSSKEENAMLKVTDFGLSAFIEEG